MRKRPLPLMGLLAVVSGAGCGEGRGGSSASGPADSPDLYQVLEAAVQYLLDDYDREDLRLLEKYGRTGVREGFSEFEPRYAISFVSFSGGVPRPDPFPAQEEVLIYDDEEKEVDRLYAMEEYDPLMEGATTAWDVLAKAMRTTEAWEYDPVGEMIGATDPPPHENTMILRLMNLHDDGFLAGGAGDGVYYVYIQMRAPWHWLAPWKWTPEEGSWIRSDVWVGHSLKVERRENGWRITRTEDPEVIFKEH